VHLESVLPRVAHRQWTLSLPFSVRFNVVKKPKLLKRLEVRLVKAVWRQQRREARRHGATGALTGGAVCFWQWFGSQLQLTPHLHLLVAEGMWQPDGTVVPVAPPSDEEVARILARVLRAAKKDWADLEAAWPEDEYEELQQRATQERLGFVEAPTPRPRARRVAVLQGFSLHADTAVHGHDRQGLERLCRYGARGPVAESRLRRLDDARYEYSPKKGTSFTLTASALVRRLVALLPPARLHLTSFHGAYAPPTPACARSSPNRPRTHPRPLPALHRSRLRHRNRSGPACTGPSFISAPSVPTCCAALVVAAASSDASTPPASRPRRASPSSASGSSPGCYLPPPPRRSCSSRCEAHLPLHADEGRPATGVRATLLIRSRREEATSAGARPAASTPPIPPRAAGLASGSPGSSSCSFVSRENSMRSRMPGRGVEQGDGLR
jgi:hypothetical protein